MILSINQKELRKADLTADLTRIMIEAVAIRVVLCHAYLNSSTATVHRHTQKYTEAH